MRGSFETWPDGLRPRTTGQTEATKSPHGSYNRTFAGSILQVPGSAGKRLENFWLSENAPGLRATPLSRAAGLLQQMQRRTDLDTRILRPRACRPGNQAHSETAPMAQHSAHMLADVGQNPSLPSKAQSRLVSVRKIPARIHDAAGGRLAAFPATAARRARPILPFRYDPARERVILVNSAPKANTRA